MRFTLGCGCCAMVWRCSGGRWDYLFSYIKTLRAHPSFVLSDRALVTMTTPFMAAYSRLLVATCHRRQVHAMGGMAAQIPIKADPQANAAALERVRADKEREVQLGHDGTWVAHPALVPVALSMFDSRLWGRPHQLDRPASPSSSTVSAAELLALPPGPPVVTAAGVHSNLVVCLSYLASWLCGVGCVPLQHLMEDAATAEISRCQLWQWARHGARMQGGGTVTLELLLRDLQEVKEAKRVEVGEEGWRKGRWEEASQLLRSTVSRPQLDDFLTVLAYPLLDTDAQAPAAVGRAAEPAHREHSCGIASRL